MDVVKIIHQNLQQVPKDRQDHLDHLDHQVRLVHQDNLEYLVLQDKEVKLVRQVTLDPQDKLVHLEHLEKMVAQDLLDLKVYLELLDFRESRDQSDQLDVQVKKEI